MGTLDEMPVYHRILTPTDTVIHYGRFRERNKLKYMHLHREGKPEYPEETSTTTGVGTKSSHIGWGAE